MIVFYKENKPTINLQENTFCDSVCSSTCGLKPKSKCCFKYKKKGINCKRCPKDLLNIAS